MAGLPDQLRFSKRALGAQSLFEIFTRKIMILTRPGMSPATRVERTNPLLVQRTNPLLVSRTDPLMVKRTNPLMVSRTDPLMVTRVASSRFLTQSKALIGE